MKRKIEKMNDQMIEVLEDYQAELSREKYQTERRISTWNYIENLLHGDLIEFECIEDKRYKINGFFLHKLGEVKRIDTSKASFIKIAYLSLEDNGKFTIRHFDHCVNFAI
ncbi:MAG: hypothetical protein ACTSR3_00960 [Candidatus Helarchaeota archaeon]